jgi:hypothetical protein
VRCSDLGAQVGAGHHRELRLLFTAFNAKGVPCLLPRTAATYRARDGRRHDVLVLTTPAGRWRILDPTETAVVHVET